MISENLCDTVWLITLNRLPVRVVVQKEKKRRSILTFTHLRAIWRHQFN